MKKRIIFIGWLLILCLTGCANRSPQRNINGSDTFKIADSNAIVPTPLPTKELEETVYLQEIREYLGINASGNPSEHFSVAIMDSGVFPHDALGDKIISFKDFVYQKKLPYDDNGHGTQIAGIIAGDSKDKNTGLAPFMDIVAVKVLDVNGKGNVENIVKGINWVVKHKDIYNIRVINISIGFQEVSNQLYNACKKAYESGIVIVSSVGNKEEIQQFNSIKSEHIILAGSMEWDERNKEMIPADYSLEPDIYTFGSNIYTLHSNTNYKGNHGEEMYNTAQYTKVSGTSFSSAVITGYVCNIIKENPQYSVEEIRKEVLSSDIHNKKGTKEIPVAKRRLK